MSRVTVVNDRPEFLMGIEQHRDDLQGLTDVHLPLKPFELAAVEVRGAPGRATI